MIAFVVENRPFFIKGFEEDLGKYDREKSMKSTTELLLPVLQSPARNIRRAFRGR